MDWITLKVKRRLHFKLIIVSIFCLLFSSNNLSFAQGGEPKQIENSIAEDKENQEEVSVIKRSVALEVLGRKLTEPELDLYGDLDAKQLKQELLHKEIRLVIVRALIAVGEEKNIKDILEIYTVSKLKTFAELVDEFNGYIEKYGSVINGLKAELVYNIKDDEQAFKQAAAQAYETVFGTPQDKQNTQEITSFLQENKALTYSKMVAVLMESMTPGVKKDILFKLLDEIGRADLKNNKIFVEKMIAQRFTHENLKKLLQQLAPKKPKK